MVDAEYKQAQFFKCDVDENQDISKNQGVRAMPTFIIYKGGKAVETVSGSRGDTGRSLSAPPTSPSKTMLTPFLVFADPAGDGRGS